MSSRPKDERPRHDGARQPAPASLGNPLASRAALLLAAAMLFLLIVAGYVDVFSQSDNAHPITGTFGLAVLAIGFLTDGLFLLVYLLSATALGWVILRLVVSQSVGGVADPARGIAGSATLPTAPGKPGIITSAALGMGALSLLSLGLGCAGALNQPTSIALLLLGPILWTATQLRSFPRLSTQHSRLSTSSWLWLLAVPALALATCCASMFPGAVWQGMDPHPYDVMSYHLQIPREWYEAGRIIRLPHNVYSNFPFLAEVQFLFFMHLRGGPWEAMYACQFFSLMCMVLTVAAVASCVRQMVEARVAPIIAGVLVASVPWIVCLGSVCYNESLLLLYFTLCLTWTLRGLRDGLDLRALAVAGAMAGLACGVKYTGAPIVAVFVPVAVIVARVLCATAGLPRRAPRPTRWLAGAAVYTLAVLVTFSPWLIRNLAWTGNIVYPMAMRTLGDASFTGQQVERWDRAHRAVDAESSIGARVSAFIKRVPADWQYGYLLLPLGVLSAIALAVRCRREPPLRVALLTLVILVLLQTAFWLFFTHLMARFAILLVPLCAMLVALAFSGPRPTPLIGGGITAIVAITGFVLIHRAFAVEARGVLRQPLLDQARTGFWRLNEPDILNPAEIQQLPADVPLALIGDAQAFYHRKPMTQVRYRMVFDIDFPPGASPIDAWLGTPEPELRKTHAVMVHPGEIRRLARTYFAVPPLPDATIPPGYVSPMENSRATGGIPWSQTGDFPQLHVPKKQP